MGAQLCGTLYEASIRSSCSRYLLDDNAFMYNCVIYFAAYEHWSDQGFSFNYFL